MPDNTNSSTASYRIYHDKMGGPYHDFWLFREREREYENYGDLLGRRDAPVSLPDDLLRYFLDTLAWVPALSPDCSPQVGGGLDLYGPPTIINHLGGEKFSDVLESWACLLRLGPEQITLSVGSTGIVGDDGELEDRGWLKLEVIRDEVVGQLKLLAEWGALAATGEFFILHLGI